MTTALTPAELAAMTARAESAAALAETGRLDNLHLAFAADVLSLAALYTASQAALTEALAELTAARAEIAYLNELMGTV